MFIKYKVHTLILGFKNVFENEKNVEAFLRLCVFALLAICLFFRCCIYLFSKDAWYDELALFDGITKSAPTDLFRGMLPHLQSAPILFVLINRLIFTYFGDSLFHLHFLPFISSCIAIVLFYLLSKKIGNIFYTFCVLLLFSLCISPLYYTSEFKQYSTELLISLILIYFSIYNLYNESDVYNILSLKRIIIYYICFLFSTPAILYIGGILTAEIIIIWRRGALRKIRFVPWQVLLFGIFVLAYYYFYLHYSGQLMIAHYKPHFIPLRWDGFWNYMQKSAPSIFYYLFSGPASSPLLLFVGLIGGSILLWRTRRDLFLLLSLPIAVTFAANFFLYAPGIPGGRWGSRLMLFSMPNAMLVAGAFYAWLLKWLVALTACPARGQRRIGEVFRCAGRFALACTLCGLIGASTWGSAYYLYTRQYQVIQISELSRAFLANITPESLNLIYGPAVFPFWYYQKKLGGKKPEVESLPYNYKPLIAKLEQLPPKRRILLLFSNLGVHVGEKGLREIEGMFKKQERIFFKIPGKDAVLYLLPEEE